VIVLVPGSGQDPGLVPGGRPDPDLPSRW